MGNPFQNMIRQQVKSRVSVTQVMASNLGQTVSRCFMSEVLKRFIPGSRISFNKQSDNEPQLWHLTAVAVILCFSSDLAERKKIRPVKRSSSQARKGTNVIEFENSSEDIRGRLTRTVFRNDITGLRLNKLKDLMPIVAAAS